MNEPEWPCPNSTITPRCIQRNLASVSDPPHVPVDFGGKFADFQQALEVREVDDFLLVGVVE